MVKCDSFYSWKHDCSIRAITNPETNPQWFTQGITYLIPKSNETNIPKNYRPISCSSTLFKILTSIVTEGAYSFYDANNIPTSEQKGCKKDVVDTDTKNKKLDQEETYKYFGKEETDGIQHGKRKENRKRESKTRTLQTSKRCSTIGA